MYEAFFFLLNDPQQAFALWLRWLVVAPRDGRGAPQVSLWGMASHHDRPIAVERVTFPIAEWQPGTHEIRIADHALSLHGSVGMLPNLRWQLTWPDAGQPDLLYPSSWMYRAPWPKTKYTAPMPSLNVSGEVTIGDHRFLLREAPGFVGHLWGREMAERWAWVQCGTFADYPTARLEALSAQIKIGPLMSPPLSLVTLTIDDHTYAFHRLPQWRAATEWTTAGWRLETSDGRYRLHLECDAPRKSLIGVTYTAPDASRRYCYHSDLAHLMVELAERHGRTWQVRHRLEAHHSARFETVSRRPDPTLALYL